MEGNHAIKFYLIARHFKENEKQLERGENAYTSGHIKAMYFNPEVVPAHLQGEVHASMKKRTYNVQVYIHLTDGVVSSECSCPRGKALCHHIAALLYNAHYNISSTGKTREWGLTTSRRTDTDIVNTVEELYPRQHFNPLISEIEDEKVEHFRKSLGSTNIVGFSWLLKPEADKHFFELVPSINDILFSREYLEALDKDAYLLDKCSVTVDRIKEIAQETVGQHSNEAWLITRKMRLTASKFGAVIGACGRNKFPPSLFKNLMEGYNLDRVLAVQWGKDNEETALNRFREHTELEVVQTGFWLHESGLLGASPDGLIGENALLEIKCPYKFRNCTIKEGVADKKYFFYYEDDNVMINCDHIYYHQIQGQLHLTNRSKCYFVAWTPQSYEVLEVERDPNWEKNLQVLQNFYFKHFVPAIFNFK